MAKMTETEAVNLIAVAAAAAAQLAVLIPTLVQNWQAIKDGLGNDDADDLNAKIVSTHGEIQALDAQLQALKGQ
jgi:hypothetical protein